MLNIAAWSFPKCPVLAVVSTELGIAPRHAPLITQLKAGPVPVQQLNGEEAFFFVSGGILEVQPHMVTVLTDTALRGADPDEASAKAAKAEAERQLADRSGVVCEPN